jgi:hypothetical protein
MKTQRGAGVEFDFAQSVVFVEDVDDPKLIDVEARMRRELSLQDFGA